MKKQSGFSLIELLVVISIIGLLASVVLVALASARARSRDAKRVADVSQMAKAMELFFNEKLYYPTSATSIIGGVLSSANALGLVPKFLTMMPLAPQPQDGICGGTSGIGNNNYWYEAPVTGKTYTITFCLGGDTGGGTGLQSGIRALTPAGMR